MEFKEGMVINCRTEDEAKRLLKELNIRGFKWALNSTKWSINGKDTCYRICDLNDVCYAGKEFYLKNGYKILEFDDLFKEEFMLKVGDKVRISEDLVCKKRYTSKDGFVENSVHEDMLEYIGKIATVTEVENALYSNVKLDIDNGRWSWIDTMFDKVEENPKSSLEELVRKCLDSVWDYKRTEEKPQNEIIYEKQDFVHTDVKKVIKNGNCVIVILNNGSKGISKCHPDDEFNLITGYKIAYNRAKIEDGKLHIKAAESMVRFYGTEF